MLIEKRSTSYQTVIIVKNSILFKTKRKNEYDLYTTSTRRESSSYDAKQHGDRSSYYYWSEGAYICVSVLVYKLYGVRSYDTFWCPESLQKEAPGVTHTHQTYALLLSNQRYTGGLIQHWSADRKLVNIAVHFELSARCPAINEWW